MTAAWHTREELVHQLVTLARQGLSRRALARALGISRNTVRGLLAIHAASREAAHTALPPRPPRVPRAAKVDAFEARVLALLALYPDITAQRVFETLREEGFDGGYTAVKKRVRALRPASRPAPSLATPEYGPGEMAESDWSPYEITFSDGRREMVQAFSYVLVSSRRKFIELYRQADLHALMDGHVRAFQRFDGCARACKYDSQKSVVLRWEGQQPIYNPRFLAFAAHYEFRPAAVRGNPNAKPRVERGFWELERSFLNGRSFTGFDDMRAQLARWLDAIADQRRHHGLTPLDRFAQEREHLVPLPRHPYDTARVVYRICSIDGFVAWDGNQYAVPYEHVTDILPVRVTQQELFVYAADLSCVARHPLAPRGRGLKLDPAGLHPPPQRKSPVDLDMLRVAFDRMGEHAARFFHLMSAGPPRLWGHQARQILLLRERYATADLDAALGHAAAFGALDFRAVERILAARANPRSLDEYVAEHTVRRIAEALGEVRTAPRDLTEYDRLPGIALPSGASRAGDKETLPCPNETAAGATTRPPAATPSSSDSVITSPSSD
ncbi:IS21 family transposase [Sorangium sp. So ce327]|jgi:transposase|uniref:IS21 family transposase n=1 Tax=Sorangium sp. So ce327 TaxID=3133301 RepID=UPI003F62FE3B